MEDSYLQTGDDAIAVKSGWDCFGPGILRDFSEVFSQIPLKILKYPIAVSGGMSCYVMFYVILCNVMSCQVYIRVF